MSSKLYRPEDQREVRPLAWRRAGGAAASVPGSQIADIAAGNRGVREAEVQQRLQEAEQRGFAAGEATGAQRTMETLKPVLATLGSIVQELSNLRAKVRHEAESGTVQLAIAIARRVLHREIATDPDAILGLVKSAAHRLNARETHRLRVAPSDATVILQHRGILNLPAAVEVVADATLVPGSAIFETSRGEMDASITTQLDEIQRGLADVVSRRAR